MQVNETGDDGSNPPLDDPDTNSISDLESTQVSGKRKKPNKRKSTKKKSKH